MKKLKGYLTKWFNGEKVRGIQVSLCDIQECARVYNSIVTGDKPEFINGKVKDILDMCGIKTAAKGIGWIVV